MADCLALWPATFFYARRYQINVLSLADLVAAAAPIGLFFGRLANFINGELYGRVTDVPWAFVFPTGGELGRHPSQLYEAGLEGLLLFVILFALARFAHGRDRPGLIAGVFLVGLRRGPQLRRTVPPTRHLCRRWRFLLGNITMGQILSAPIIIAGIVFIVYAVRHERLELKPSREHGTTRSSGN